MVLVTGGTGFLGLELVEQLVANGEAVRVIYRDAKRLEKLRHLEDKVEFFEADILDVSLLEQAMQGITSVYHSAAHISFRKADYNQLMKVNVEGTANVVNAMLFAGVKRLVHVSSIAAIGGWPYKLITEETKWEKNPFNSRYGLSKMLAEREVFRGMEEGLEVVVVNPGVIIGPGLWEEKSMPRLFDAVEKGMPFFMSGTNAYVDVKDVAKAMLLLMKAPINGERYILISENKDLQSLLSEIARLLGKKEPQFKLPQIIAQLLAPADAILSWISGKKQKLSAENIKISLQHFEYSSQKFQQEFGFKFIPVSDSLIEIAAEFRKYKSVQSRAK